MTAGNTELTAENGTNFHRQLGSMGKLQAFVRLLGGSSQK